MIVRRALRCVGVVALLLPCASHAQAQTARTAILPDTITVGDVVTAAVRIGVPPGATVSLPDSLVLPQDVENAGARVVKADTTSGAITITAQYPIAVWRPGAYALPTLQYVVNGATYSIAFDSVRVQSVLPADTSNIHEKPLKSVLGGTRVWWPWLLLLVALALAAALLYWWWKRRQRRNTNIVLVPSRPAREVALERLEAARASGYVERGELKEFYSEVSDALREYVAALDLSMSEDLTTSELASRVRARGAPPAGVELLSLLGAADLVKFARRAPRPADAQEEWTRVREWVTNAEWPPVDESADRGVAA